MNPYLLIILLLYYFHIFTHGRRIYLFIHLFRHHIGLIGQEGGRLLEDYVSHNPLRSPSNERLHTETSAWPAVSFFLWLS